MQQVTQRIIIVFLLVVVTALSLKSCFRKQKENAILKDVVEIKQDSTSFWKDRYDTEHAGKQVAEANLSSLRVAYGALIDTIQARTGSKGSDLQAVTAASTSGTGKVTPKIDTVYLADSSREYKFRYNDRWLDLDGIIGKESLINYRFSDSIVLTTYRKKTGFLRKATYLDGYSLNPNVRITGLTGVRVSNNKQQRFGIGPYVGYGWNGSSWSPNVGISFHYSFIKW